MRGVAARRSARRSREYLELVGLAHAAERYPNELSGGMQQRVGVARALANEPDVLLMDEPFASVDAQTRMTLQEELTRIWQERRPTIIFITHDVSEAVFLANRVVVLSKGHVLAEIDIDLPRPRSWDALHEDDGFKALSGQVLQLVRRHELRGDHPRLDQGADRPPGALAPSRLAALALPGRTV
jgi:NitT/TauT family transport system ATP-binding protein